MTARLGKYRTVRLSILAVVTALGMAAARPAVAGDLAKLDASLKLIPADAAFYTSTMHNREQFEAVKNSKAWAKVMEMPFVQFGLFMYNVQVQTPGTIPAQLAAVLENPDARKILDLLADMASDEVFVYGDKKVVDLVQLFQIVNTARNFGPLTVLANGGIEGRRRSSCRPGPSCRPWRTTRS